MMGLRESENQIRKSLLRVTPPRYPEVGRTVPGAFRVGPLLLSVILLVSLVGALGVVDAPPPGEVPFDDLRAIEITIDRVEVVHTLDLAVRGEVIAISDPDARVDLLGLQDGVLTSLGISQLPVGYVTQLRLVVSGASCIFFDGTRFALTIPGGVIRLHGLLIVGGSETLILSPSDILFTFDPEESLVLTGGPGGPGFILKPSLKFDGAMEDQVNDPASLTGFNCFPFAFALVQGFTPTVGELHAVALRFQVEALLPDTGLTARVNVRSGSPVGPILDSALTRIPGPQDAGTQLLVPFVYPPAIPVNPGETLFISWRQPGPLRLSWMGQSADVYPGGEAFGCPATVSLPDTDLNFRTFTV